MVACRRERLPILSIHSVELRANVLATAACSFTRALMSRITSSVGLITGIPIEETVTKLMAVAARPRELVVSRTRAIDAERLAITKLTSLALAFEFEANRLASSTLFDRKTATSFIRLANKPMAAPPTSKTSRPSHSGQSRRRRNQTKKPWVEGILSLAKGNPAGTKNETVA